MVKRWLTLGVILLLAIVWACPVWALEPFKVNRYVTDQAGLLSETQADQLARQLHQYAQDTGNQLLIITVPSLENRELVEFTEALFTLNRPGQKGKDNGLILLVVKEGRKIKARIEVGYGLEEAIPDGKAGTIIREELKPRFLAGDYSGGIVAGAAALVKAITPDYLLKDVPRSKTSRGSGQKGFSIFAWLVVLLLIVFTNIFRRKSHHGHYYGGDGGYSSQPWIWSSGGGFSEADSGGSSIDGSFEGGDGDFGGGGADGDW